MSIKLAHERSIEVQQIAAPDCAQTATARRASSDMTRRAMIGPRESRDGSRRIAPSAEIMRLHEQGVRITDPPCVANPPLMGGRSTTISLANSPLLDGKSATKRMANPPLRRL